MDPKLADWLGIPADAESLTLKLAQPIKVGTTDYAEITLTEPTLGQMEEAGKKAGPAFAEDIALIAVVAKVPDQVARGLPATAYKKAVAFLNVFLMAAPSAGDPS